jgi:hypothetical protein
MFVAVYLTVADRSFAVEPDYYQQSMDWDARMAQQRRNEQLGWQVELSVADEANRLRRSQVPLPPDGPSRQPA